MFPVSIKGVLLVESKNVLLLENNRDEWELPGGRIEIGETPTECLAREFKEELDIDVEVTKLLDSYLFEVIPGKYVFIVTYLCEARANQAPTISDEHTSFGVFDIHQLPDKLPTGYRLSIQNATQTSGRHAPLAYS